MKHAVRLFVLAALPVLFVGCRWGQPLQTPAAYLPTQAGLTLIYENPQLEGAQRFSERLQVRVAEVTEVNAGRVVRQTFTTLRGEFPASFIEKDGGLWLSQDGQTPLLMVRPEGFPDKVTFWTARNGVTFRVVGRAAVELHGLKLMSGMNPVGVWLESASGDGRRVRTFLLPELGEVETLEWRDGAWISVNRLVSVGFTEAAPRREP
ncbi:MAG: hypothetical protein LWX11_04095 [Firmicutes bacterium]|nr:hypothetical protein [Bacillota bacterium]